MSEINEIKVDGDGLAGAKLQVTRRALCQRISRRLAAESIYPVKVCKARSYREQNKVGEYYVVNNNLVTHQHIDPEAWGREMGVLKPYEEVID